MNPTVRYLLKEMLLRWKTRVSSPLARTVLTFTLSLTAAAFQAGLSASTTALRAQLERFGLDTLTIRSVQASDSGVPLPPAAAHWSHPLAAHGDWHALVQIPGLLENDWGGWTPVYAARWTDLNLLHEPAAPAPAAAEAVWLTRDWPAGRTGRFAFPDGTPLTATSRAPLGPWRLLSDSDVVLVPPELVPPEKWRGTLDVVLFKPENAGSISAWAGAVRRFFQNENAPPPAIQNPGPLREALERLEQGQNLWRGAILCLLGGGVLLVFGAIGVLEQREMRFSQALLRSMGVRPGLLWAAAFCENMLLANGAFLLAVTGMHSFGTRLLRHVPAFEQTPALPAGGDFFLHVSVNIGVLLSLVPLAKALKTPVGTTLS
jgi:hypothetical protein